MIDKRSAQILICTGHTGGHFFPALSCAETFRAEHPEAEIHFLIPRVSSFAEPLISKSSFHFHVIGLSAAPPFFSLKAVLFLLECIRAVLRTFFLLLKIRPRVVIGFGSYGSVPGVLCAAFLGIPILLHEQNALAGRANQFLAFWAKRIAVSFPQTQGRFSVRKVFWSGYPLRSLFYQETDEPRRDSSDEKPFTILVFGGSQGAKRLNQIFLKVLEIFKAEERTFFAVIHIIGSDDLEGIKGWYHKLGVRADVSNFSYQISGGYKRADLVISRAGAGTIFELAMLGRAAILIPYPHAYAHQKVNAEYLAERGAARVILDGELSANALREAIVQLRDDARLRTRLEENIRRLAKPEASRLLVEAGWKLACEKNSYV